MKQLPVRQNLQLRMNLMHFAEAMLAGKRLPKNAAFKAS